jgi:LacI family transcriptional regulator
VLNRLSWGEITTERLTIKDIAAMAGVTPGTVSRVVNGRPGVGPDMRAQIERLIAEHGYRANSSARHLSTGRSHMIAVVFPLHVSEVILHPVYPELIGALGDAAEDAGYDLLLLTASSKERLHHVVEAAMRGNIDGAVLPAASPRDPIVSAVSMLGIPHVMIGHRGSRPNAGWVDCTHDQAAEELTARMLRAGRNRLVLINGPQQVSACRLRSKGFWKALDEAGIPRSGAQEYSVPFTSGNAKVVASQILSRRERPDGIVAGADAIASSVLDAARELGINVPDAVAVTGFNDQPFAIHTAPTLTTVRMPLSEIGQAAGRMLFELIDKRTTSTKIVLPTTVIVRKSTPEGF